MKRLLREALRLALTRLDPKFRVWVLWAAGAITAVGATLTLPL